MKNLGWERNVFDPLIGRLFSVQARNERKLKEGMYLEGKESYRLWRG